MAGTPYGVPAISFTMCVPGLYRQKPTTTPFSSFAIEM